MSTTGTTPRVSRKTIEDRLRMASTTTMRYDNGVGITSGRDSRRIARAVENLVNHVVEDGIEYEDEKDAFADFHNAILKDIDRQIVDFAYRIENELRAARWAAVERAADGSIVREGVSGWNR